ncbi:energy transducer TonB [Sunxiuqinia sp. sy24]|uniref:energy transducer TonB n=1 Tax=Sunxiuqinia sp. sy24 TaxID=3461495 RepID=UPI0040463EF9
MRTSILFVLIMVLSLGASAQYHKMESEIEVRPPLFKATPVNLADKEVSLNDFVAENMIYPETAVKSSYEGTEVIEFTVTTDGTLSNFRVINSVSADVDDELIRVLKLTNGMWIPGSNNDGYVDMQREISVACRIKIDNGSGYLTDFKEQATKHFKKGSKLLYINHHPRRALANFDKGIRYLPHDANLLVLRGYAKFALDDLDGAIEDWQIVKEKTNIDTLKEIAKKHNDLEGYAELLAEFDK